MSSRNQAELRIITLLAETEMTFKQIIMQLKNENINASFNTIRRVNRNHQYRRPRYDPKLTLKQREELVVTLKNTDKPNLSILAKQYGVCHGSIWYWWDKLNKAKQLKDQSGDICNNKKSPGGSMESANTDNEYKERKNSDDSLSGFSCGISDNVNYNDNYAKLSSTTRSKRLNDNYSKRDLVGRVQAVSRRGDLINLPILMFTKSA